ncbi:MAG TPA: zinc ribbon domain-containing protein [Casimicrobiaceae bacterium]
MPIYEYRCSSCGHQLEVLQKFSDPPQVECPHCHRPDLVKLVSPVGFQLKGSGWYVTDFRNSGAKPARKTDEKRPGDAETAAEDRPATAGADNGSGNGEARDGATASASSAAGKGEGKSAGDAKPASGSAPAGGTTSTGSTSGTSG